MCYFYGQLLLNISLSLLKESAISGQHRYNLKARQVRISANELSIWLLDSCAWKRERFEREHLMTYYVKQKWTGLSYSKLKKKSTYHYFASLQSLLLS